MVLKIKEYKTILQIILYNMIIKTVKAIEFRMYESHLFSIIFHGQHSFFPFTKSFPTIYYETRENEVGESTKNTCSVLYSWFIIALPQKQVEIHFKIEVNIKNRYKIFVLKKS